MPWLGWAPLALLLERCSAGRLAFLWGLAFWVVSLHWIVPTMVTFGGLSAGLTWPLFLLLAAYLALFPGVWAVLARPIWRSGRPLLAMFGVASAWVVLEWVRAWLFGGFPWNALAYAWVGVPGALEASAWIGAYGVSFLVVWANSGVALSLARRDWRPLAWGLLGSVVLLVMASRWAPDTASVDQGLESRVETRVLQPDIPNQPVWDPARNLEDYRKLVAQSLEACDREGVLLVWPESAAWPRRLGRDLDLERDLRMLNERGCSVLVNTARERDGLHYNSAVLARDDGQRPFYDKRHLVPFGEYVPLGRLLPFLETLARGIGDFTPGGEVRLLETPGGVLLGPAICYEVVFPAEVAETVRAGATVLVSITNDDWYGPTSAAWQHLRAARFRAAESRRFLLRAAITGVSAVISPRGDLVAVAVPGERKTLRATVAPRTELTLYSRFAGAVPPVAILATCFAIFLSGRRQRSSPGR